MITDGGEGVNEMAESKNQTIAMLPNTGGVLQASTHDSTWPVWEITVDGVDRGTVRTTDEEAVWDVLRCLHTGEGVQCDGCGIVVNAVDGWTNGFFALCGGVYGNGCDAAYDH